MTNDAQPPAGTWRRASRCAANGCVEVAIIGPPECPMTIAVRDSKNPTVPPLTYTVDEWRTFIAAVKAGEFDV